MLSRTADHVYWLGRYAERAENLARTLDVEYRLSLLPQQARSGGHGWAQVLRALSLDEAYTERHETVEAHLAIDFLAFDPGNPSSILSCLRAARENARAVRGSISSEMWETFNTTWLEARSQAPTRFTARNVAEFVDWVKYRAHLARGVVLGSMLRDEGYHFMQIGTFLERADGVARLLQARLAGEPPSLGSPAATHDYYPWSVLLRALSAFEIFRRVSRDSVSPEHVLHFVVFRNDVPRSVYRSAELVYENLRAVANAQSGETERRAGKLHADLRFGAPQVLADGGAVPFLAEVLARIADLSDRIGRDFLGHTSSG
ncbi:MAG: alpha-E domain-containing protein [Steroidobacteraceae bacterium]